MAGLDRVIHEPARLRILSVLSGVDQVDFNFLLNALGLTNGNLSLNLAYLEVPLLVMARIPAGDSPIWPILYVGPVISFEVDCKLKSTNLSVDCDAGGNPASRTDGTDFGATFGLGFEFFFGSVRSQLDARYTLGLNDINATDTGPTVKNRGWTFLFGLGYALSP